MLTCRQKLFFLLLSFFALPAAAQPIIASFSPAGGPAGTTVTVTGSGFNSDPNSNIVYFGAVRAVVTGGSATSLVVTLPTGATYKPISVLNTATGRSGSSAGAFIPTFTNPFGTGIPANYFLPKVDYYSEYYPVPIATGDIDGDGKPDLITSKYPGLDVRRNVSATGIITTNSFAPSVPLPSNGSTTDPRVILIKDMDGDGKPDIISVSSYRVVTIWRNATTPGNITSSSFANPVTLQLDGSSVGGTQSVAAGDLDGDGRPELVVCQDNIQALPVQQSRTVSVFRNLSAPGSLTAASFAPKVDFQTDNSPSSVTIADLDNDGKADLITANAASLSVLRNVSVPGSIDASSFAPHVEFPGSSGGPRSLATGDIDGDGKPEILALNGSLSVLYNQSTPGMITSASFAPTVFPASGRVIDMGDIDGDGKPDAVCSGVILRNTASPGGIDASSFAPPVDFASVGGYNGVALGDLDSDGIPELAFSSSSATVSVIHVNTSSGPPQISSFAPASAPVGSTVNIMGQGFNANPAGNVVYFGAVKATVISGSTFSLNVVVPPGASYQPLSVLNSDNGLTGYASKPFVTTFSNPYGTAIPTDFYKPKIDFGTGTLPYFIAVSDLDGDGKPDMVVANSSASTVSVLRNISTSGIGITSFATRVDFPVGNDPRAVLVKDLDGDGKPDIVTANAGSSTLSVLRNMSASGSIGAASFAPKVDFATGEGPFSLASGDLDLDGRPDLVVANATAGTVSVLHNQAATGALDLSSFAAKVDFTAGSSPRSVTVSDLNVDGRPDIAVANAQTAQVSVLASIAVLGMIDASSFAAPFSLGVGNSPNWIGASDINGDGRPELITVNYGSNTLSLLPNTSVPDRLTASSFGSRVDFTTGQQPFFAAVSDLDGDGKPDLAVVNTASTNISVLRNTAVSSTVNSSSLAPKIDFTAGNYPLAIAASDLDGNGIAELITADASTNTVSALAFSSPRPLAVYSVSPAAAPVGATVTIAGDNFDSTASLNQVLFGAVKAEVTGSTGNTLQVKVPAGATYAPVVVSKTSNELAAASPLPFDPTFVNPFGSSIPANFYRPKVDISLSGPYTYGVVFGDVNGDGKPELITVNQQANTLSISRNVSATGSITPASFAAPFNLVAAAAPRAVAFADIDGYFYPDILVLSPSSYTLSVYRNTYNNGNLDANTFYPRQDFFTGSYASSFAVGDLDGDGRPDVVFTNPYSNSVTVRLNQSTHPNIPLVAFAAGVSYPAGNFPRSVSVIDVNGDGKRDIVVANEQGNAVSVLLNRSVYGNINTSSFAPAATFPVGSNPTAIAAGDLDGDGKPEIVTSNYSSGTVSVLRNISPFGTGSAAQFASGVDFITDITPSDVSIGDADGDGKPDIITANATTSTISVLRNTAAGGAISFAGKVDFVTGGYPLGLAVGDLDGDGLAEVATANASSGAAAVSIFKIADPAAMSATAAAAIQAGAAGTEPMTVQAYPNPTKGEFRVRLQGIKAAAVTVELLSESGKIIEYRTVNTGGKAAWLALSLRQQPAGTYYVKVISTDGMQVTKVVVQR